MRVIAIDPGTRHLGWGVIQREGTRITHVAHGVIHTDTEGPFAGRLITIDDGLRVAIEAHQPDEAAVESLFFAKDAQSAAKLGHARGVVLLRLAKAGLPIAEYAPTQVKRAVVGRGLAEKKQVAMVVSAVLGLREIPAADAADALAIALTHLQAAGFQAALAASRR